MSGRQGCRPVCRRSRGYAELISSAPHSRVRTHAFLRSVHWVIAMSSPLAVSHIEQPEHTFEYDATGLSDQPAPGDGFVGDVFVGDVNAVDSSGSTALHRAAQEGRRERVLSLLKAGADPEARTLGQRRTPLHLAAAAGHAELLPLLITPSTLDAEDQNIATPLHLAVRHKRPRAAAALIAAGASPTGGLDSFSCSPLWEAFIASKPEFDPEMCLLLVDAMLEDPGSAVALEQAVREDLYDGYLLHFAASCGCKELVCSLLEAGADRDAVAPNGATPLHYAVEGGHAELVPLLATPANINLGGPAGYWHNPPLYTAAARGRTQVVSLLLAAGAAADVKGWDSKTALAVAAKRGHMQVVSLLLKALAKQYDRQQDQAKLAELVAAAVKPVREQAGSSLLCSLLLEVVLDVLGPGLARDVYQQVLQQLPALSVNPQAQPSPMAGHLAEPLLLGWVRAEEQLHAARQPLVARLQHLVVHAGHGTTSRTSASSSSMQQGGQEGEAGMGRDLVCLVIAAHHAAAQGHQQQALDLLGKFAALQHQHEHQHQQRADMCSSAASSPPSEATTSGAGSMPISSGGGGYDVRELIRKGLATATATCTSQPSQLWEVYSTFLAAWLRARERLQQLPQEVAAAVVAAVEAAGQQRAVGSVGEVGLLTYHTAMLQPAGTAAAPLAAAVATQTEQQLLLPLPFTPHQQHTTAQTEPHSAQQQQVGTQTLEVPLLTQQQQDSATQTKAHQGANHHQQLQGTQTEGPSQQLHDAQTQTPAQQQHHPSTQTREVPLLVQQQQQVGTQTEATQQQQQQQQQEQGTQTEGLTRPVHDAHTQTPAHNQQQHTLVQQAAQAEELQGAKVAAGGRQQQARGRAQVAVAAGGGRVARHAFQLRLRDAAAALVGAAAALLGTSLAGGIRRAGQQQRSQ